MIDAGIALAFALGLALLGTLAVVDVRRDWHHADACVAHGMKPASRSYGGKPRMCVDPLGHTFIFDE